MLSSRATSFGLSLKSRWKYGLGATLLIAFALRIFRYTVTGLFVKEWSTDERVGTIKYSAMDPLQLFTTLPFKDTHPPLYYLLMHYWRGLFGSSLASLRFPSVVFGTATVLGIYLLGRELRNEQVGLISALLVATSPFYVSVSQYARAYALFALSIVFSWFFLLRFSEDRRRILAVGYVISTAIMASIHVYGGFLVLGQWLYLAASTTILSEDYPIRKVIGLQVLAAILTFPVLLDIGILVYAHPNAASAKHLEFPTPGILLQSLGAYLGGQYSILLASIIFGISIYVIWSYLSKNVQIRDHIWKLSVKSPASTNELTMLASLGLPVVVLPIIISLAILPMWDDVAAIGASLALVMLTALAIEDLDSPRHIHGTLTVLVGLNFWILTYYFV